MEDFLLLDDRCRDPPKPEVDSETEADGAATDNGYPGWDGFGTCGVQLALLQLPP